MAKMAEMTLTDFLPYMSPHARRATRALAREQGKSIDDLDVEQVIARANEYRDGERVADRLGCPRCGETHMDRLEWDSAGERVTCTMCGAVYVPGEVGG